MGFEGQQRIERQHFMLESGFDVAGAVLWKEVLKYCHWKNIKMREDIWNDATSAKMQSWQWALMSPTDLSVLVPKWVMPVNLCKLFIETLSPPLQPPIVREGWISIELYPEISVRDILNYSRKDAYASPSRSNQSLKMSHVDECHANICSSDRHCLWPTRGHDWTFAQGDRKAGRAASGVEGTCFWLFRVQLSFLFTPILSGYSSPSA